MTDENLFFKLATRNSQLATVIALSSALLLTACGGSSHSSGNTKPQKNENKPSTSKPQTPKSKIDTLVGYWKSDCDKKRSERHYYQIVKYGKNDLKIAQKVVEEFKQNNCSGKSEFYSRKSRNLTQEHIDKIKLQGTDSFIAPLYDGRLSKQTRIQAKDFPIIK